MKKHLTTWLLPDVGCFFSMPSEGLTYTDIKPFRIYIPQIIPQTFYVIINIIYYYIEINIRYK